MHISLAYLLTYVAYLAYLAYFAYVCIFSHASSLCHLFSEFPKKNRVQQDSKNRLWSNCQLKELFKFSYYLCFLRGLNPRCQNRRPVALPTIICRIWPEICKQYAEYDKNMQNDMQNIMMQKICQKICKPVFNMQNTDKSIFCIFCIYHLHSPLCWCSSLGGTWTCRNPRRCKRRPPLPP